MKSVHAEKKVHKNYERPCLIRSIFAITRSTVTFSTFMLFPSSRLWLRPFIWSKYARESLRTQSHVSQKNPPCWALAVKFVTNFRSLTFWSIPTSSDLCFSDSASPVTNRFAPEEEEDSYLDLKKSLSQTRLPIASLPAIPSSVSSTARFFDISH